MHRIPVKEIMQLDVITVTPQELVVDADEIMEEFGIRRLPVVDDEGFLIGIVTDTDVLEAEAADSVVSSYDPAAAHDWLTVGDIMSPNVITLTPEATVGELAQLLLREKIGGVPVVAPGADVAGRPRMVGIVTESDIFKLLAQAWAGETAQVEG